MADYARIVTSQNVVIDYPVASIGDRVLARLIDVIFFAAYLFVAVYFVSTWVANAGSWEAREEIVLALTFIVPLPVLTYTVWCETLLNGRTFGKLILGLKVVKKDGSPAGLGDFAMRWVTRLLEAEFGVFSWLALPVAMISDSNQRIGDMVAGTIVINVKERTSLRSTILASLNPQYQIVFPQVGQLNDRDMNIIKDVMMQAVQTGNYGLLEQLGNKVKQTLGVFPNPQQLPTMQFLNIVLADYAHYGFDKGK